MADFASVTPVLLQKDNDTRVTFIPRHSRIGMAIIQDAYKSSQKRARLCGRLAKLGFTNVYHPSAGWASTAHLAVAGWFA